MTSTTLMLAMIAAYLVIVGTAAWERDWARVLYYVCAAGISVAVLWMSEAKANT